jgi:hypothetical protein
MLPAHQLMRKDVMKRLKKVLRRSPVWGESYGRWCDSSGGRGVALILSRVFLRRGVVGRRREDLAGFFWLFHLR